LDLLKSNRAKKISQDNTHQEDEHLKSALRDIPPRGLTDSLIYAFLESGNYTFYVVQPAVFLDEYESWWGLRAKKSPVSPGFTSLLLEICALSAQCSSNDIGKRLEYEMAESTDETSSRFHEASSRLARSISPGRGGLYLGLRHLLSASWLKAEGRTIDAWHELSLAIREAQECGMCKNVVIPANMRAV
jgi:hypothetical protein